MGAGACMVNGERDSNAPYPHSLLIFPFSRQPFLFSLGSCVHWCSNPTGLLSKQNVLGIQGSVGDHQGLFANWQIAVFENANIEWPFEELFHKECCELLR